MNPRSFLLATIVITAVSCGGSDDPSDLVQDQTATVEPAVPQVVRDQGAKLTRRLGPGVRCTEWLWDSEHARWRCAVSGLSRSSELDVLPDGRFSQLDLVLGFPEIQATAPVVAETLAATCRDPVRTVAELSLRSEDLLDIDPRLEKLWNRDGVFIEIQCPDGKRLEIDAYGTVVATSEDDSTPE